MIINNPICDNDALIRKIKEQLLLSVANEKLRIRMRIEDELERTYYKDLRAKDEIIKQKDEIILAQVQVIEQKEFELKQKKQELKQKIFELEQKEQELEQKEQELKQKDQELARLRLLLEQKNK